jgi:proteasome lid subunit RPN8/RPN11
MSKSDSSKNTSNGPDYEQTDTTSLKSRAFPFHVRSEYRVLFDDDAYNSMMDHANSTVEVELGGVLVGNALFDERGPYLQIVGVLPAEGAQNRDTQITFTHQAWDKINSRLDEEYHEYSLIGWYHTHPGFGIFLSEMDMFIQENFFSEPFQVAVVLDTKSHEEGCFIWVGGKSTPIDRYWVGTKEIQLVGKKTGFSEKKLSGDSENKSTAAPQVSGVNLWTVIPTALLALFILLMGSIVSLTRSDLYSQRQHLSAITVAIHDVQMGMSEDRITVADEFFTTQRDLTQMNDQVIKERTALENELSLLMQELKSVKVELEVFRARMDKEISTSRDNLVKIAEELVKYHSATGQKISTLNRSLSESRIASKSERTALSDHLVAIEVELNSMKAEVSFNSLEIGQEAATTRNEWDIKYRELEKKLADIAEILTVQSNSQNQPISSDAEKDVP